MSTKEELQRLVDLLSDYECQHLLNIVQDVAAGERFWEGDVGIFYNENVKLRQLNISRNLSNTIPTEPTVNEDYFTPIPIFKSYTNTEQIKLPPSTRLEQPITEALLRRRSRRDYTGEAISLKQLSTLLHHACGVTGFIAGYGYTHLPLRSFPSSGDLQAPEVYLSIQSVDNMPVGLYHYHPMEHILECLKPGNHGPTLCALALGQLNVEKSAVVFVITGYYERVRWKYGERGYRYMCMDTGFLGENIYLAAEALRLGVCAIAGFVDDALEEFLGINGQDEVALLLISVGVPST